MLSAKVINIRGSDTSPPDLISIHRMESDNKCPFHRNSAGWRYHNHPPSCYAYS